jgi:hypothetical protein
MKRYLVVFFALVLSIRAAPPAAPDEGPKQRAGKYEVTLRLPSGGLFAGEEMQIEFRVVDASQVDPVMGAAPIVRAQVQGSIGMPAMPGMPKYEETAHPEGIPGEYGIHPTFSHGGEFRLRLAVNPPAGEAFHVDFDLNVADASDAAKRKPGPRPYRIEVATQPRHPKAGESVELQLRVRRRDPEGIVTAFDIAHEKPMHVMIIRDDLTQFGHEHPEKSADGTFRLRYTFPTGGDYHVFVDTAPRGAGSQVLMAKVPVQGGKTDRFDVRRAPAETRSLVKKVEGVEIEMQSGSLPARRTTGVTFTLRDAATGRAITDLQPYLGAMGHLILIHQDGITFVHSHPDERVPDAGRDGKVPFLVRFPKPGIYRGWSQFQRHGNVLTGDFIVEATEGAGQ